MLVVFGRLSRPQIFLASISRVTGRTTGLGNRLNPVMMLLFLVSGWAARAGSSIASLARLNRCAAFQSPPIMATTSSSLLAFAAQRCPRCHQGRVFKTSAFSPRFQEMHASCPACHQHYEPEPGFYWGAMYISYAFSVAIVVAVGIAVFVLGHDPDTWVYVAGVAITTIMMVPLSFRYSRMVMLYLFAGFDYDPAMAATVARRPVAPDLMSAPEAPELVN